MTESALLLSYINYDMRISLNPLSRLVVVRVFGTVSSVIEFIIQEGSSARRLEQPLPRVKETKRGNSSPKWTDANSLDSCGF